jgi:hypothetical protein
MGYWLLIGHYPFEVEQPDPDDALADAILHQAPQAPHLLNPRVPRALSEVCLPPAEEGPRGALPGRPGGGGGTRGSHEGGEGGGGVARAAVRGVGAGHRHHGAGAVLSEEDWRRRAERVEAYKRAHPVRGVPVLPAEPRGGAASQRGGRGGGREEGESLDAPALPSPAVPVRPHRTRRCLSARRPPRPPRLPRRRAVLSQGGAGRPGSDAPAWPPCPLPLRLEWEALGRGSAGPRAPAGRRAAGTRWA